MTTPQRFRKKPVEIEAKQITDDLSAIDIVGWMNSHGVSVELSGARRPFALKIATLEGVMLAEPGDWVIRGVAGEFYPCKPDIFAQTYETIGPCAPAEELGR
ncbi:Uncharacterised protein [Mycobacteroides abscessus subsp. bolletii]|uniref:Uncharacterized protein n=1 Tax=Mycobacteroides abscessus subsp. bolletii TaxID=319705 RepID=A0A9Q7SEM6_9MYCO|nr:hypothetical protein [Mycobacteroides abscessus]SHT85455.1 Uncharacterised protein [Mycobacteroides abscessus subsp. bolletii]SHU02366.1 Uncharacterised protein [Mycobacteroides abscessus subsp. bolletii]SHX42928.1 Uncharacterised protein [Mycobacteroides abscessus subsp. bolletii]SKM64823.1 Uncharacterised protein [Mycobacteroides abscessus subsp. bolletii]SKN38990.1 Uncharacterised protein [Mycobacteroides abscessus subsp. bolletii]